MVTSCSAFAYASELSLSTFNAIAAFTGAATFALMSDIAARSGSGSPAIFSSSSRESLWYCSWVLPMSRNLPSRLVALVDVDVLLGVGVSDRVVAGHVERNCGVDRRGDVRVDE